LVYFFFHFIFFGLFDFCNLIHGVNFDFGSHDLDFIVVHRSVGAHNFTVLELARTAHGDVLFQDETVRKERVSNRSSGLLDDMDIV
jgi:hypothetical protein